MTPSATAFSGPVASSSWLFSKEIGHSGACLLFFLTLSLGHNCLYLKSSFFGIFPTLPGPVEMLGPFLVSALLTCYIVTLWGCSLCVTFLFDLLHFTVYQDTLHISLILVPSLGNGSKVVSRCPSVSRVLVLCFLECSHRP